MEQELAEAAVGIGNHDRAATLSNLSIPCHAEHVCSFLRDRKSRLRVADTVISSAFRRNLRAHVAVEVGDVLALDLYLENFAIVELGLIGPLSGRAVALHVKRFVGDGRDWTHINDSLLIEDNLDRGPDVLRLQIRDQLLKGPKAGKLHGGTRHGVKGSLVPNDRVRSLFKLAISDTQNPLLGKNDDSISLKSGHFLEDGQ